MKALLLRNWLTIALFAALGAALAAPSAGRALGAGGLTSTATVAVIFFLSGLALPTEEMLRGLRQWRLHAYVQVLVFVVAPLFFFFTYPVLGEGLGEDMRIGILALGCLPTTISSCIVLTQLAGGNTAGAIFNAVFANLTGIVVSPLLLTLMLRGAGRMLPGAAIGRILVTLALTVLLPFLVGQGVHRLVAPWARRRRPTLTRVSGALIVLIVYLAFAHAADHDGLREVLPRLPAVFAYVAVGHVVLLLVAWAGAHLLGFDRADRAVAVFAGPQKTQALGVPLLATYLAAEPTLAATALLPLLFYHQWQLMVAGLVVNTRLVAKAGHAAEAARGTG